MKKFGLVVGLVLVISGFSFGAGGVLLGSGTEGSPYLIEDRADFDLFCTNTSYWASGVYTRLETNLDLSDTNYIAAPIARDWDGWNPTGYDGTPFGGVFDGNNHVISNLVINAPPNYDYLGLFGVIGGRVSNLGLEGGSVRGVHDGNHSSDYTGSLCGWNGGTISNCYATGTVGNGYYSHYIGGLCGYNFGTIIESYATGSTYLGSTGYFLGGLCGYNSGEISKCYATGEVNSEDEGTDSIGGFCGRNNGAIDNSYATGRVKGGGWGSSNVGGFCGDNIYRTTTEGVRILNTGVISNCYSTGRATGYSYVGGFCGNLDGSITASFWDTQTSLTTSSRGGTGRTTAEMQMLGNYIGAGWDFSDESANGTNDVWIMDGYPKLIFSTDSDGDGITDFWEMEYFGTLDRDGTEDYDGDTLNDADEINNRLNPTVVDTDGDGTDDGIEIANGFDPLVYDFPETGTELDPYLIPNRAAFNAFCADSAFWTTGICARLDTNLDLNDTTYTRAPIAPDTSADPEFQGTAYSGVFDGNGYTISNLTINTLGDTRDYLGLFGRIDGASSSVEVKNITLRTVSINAGSSSSYVGGICGYNTSATVVGCHVVTGNVASVNNCDNMGGICGKLNYGTIEDCSFNGSVSGSDNLGGLCGYINHGTLRDCSTTVVLVGLDSPFSQGDFGSDNLGGLCGYNYYGSIQSSYASVEISGADANAGGICGYTTGDLTDCYATGWISGIKEIGGLCGHSLVGPLRDCYATVLVSGNTDLGGLCGYNSATVHACFWDTQASGQTNSAGGAGKTTAEMQTQSTFTDAGWDFMDETVNGTSDVWAMNGYPVLAWQLPSLPPVFELVVEFGSGDGSFMEGAAIQLMADAVMPGFRFNGWTAVPLSYTNNLMDASASSTTFTMPSTNIILTATYFQWDSDLDGLDDEWEQQIVDADPGDGIESVADVLPGDDYDGDGVSNSDEYSMGRNPVVIEAMISNLAVAQVYGTKRVNITFDLFSEITNTLSISLSVSNGIEAVTAGTRVGDIGSAVSTGAVRTIEWDAGSDWDENQAELTFVISVDDVEGAFQDVTGEFDTRNYTLMVFADHGNPAPSVGSHSNYCWHSSVTCSVEEVASDGWMFMGWSGDASTPYTQTNVTVLMDALSKSVTANFSDDADGDGLKNTNEWVIGSNPRMSDTDGDGFDDAFEVGKGLSPTNDDSDVVSYISDHDEFFGLYSSNAVLDIAVGQILLEVYGGNASLQLQLEQSEDLQSWTNAGDAVDWVLPVDGAKKFYRIRAYE